MRKLIAILLMLAVCCFAIWGAAHAQSGGDANGSGSVTMSDVVYTINYIFGGGPAPVACPCPEVWFLFDDDRELEFETYTTDTNWIEAYIGGDTLRRVDGLRRCYSMGSDSVPTYYLLIPETKIDSWLETSGEGK